MSRGYNFSPGPALLPEPVLASTREAIIELGDAGAGLMEISHRSPQFMEVIDGARERMLRLLGLDDSTHEVLFLAGGARTQFYLIPMNLLRGGRATYLDTGTWADLAAVEARRYGTVDVPFSSKSDGWTRVPKQGEWGPLPEGTRYVHYTSNNTVAGGQFHYVPDTGDAWLICDASSDFLSAPIDGSKFDILYGGAQKNLGPAGTTVVVFRKSLLDECDPEVPTMCRYGTHVSKRSLYNTPPVLPIFVVAKVLEWIEQEGGLAAVGARNAAQAARVYGEIDRTDFWRGKVDPGCRSLMNITFTTGDEALDAQFASRAADVGLKGLKGHRSVGGLRASLYNAQTDEAVDALLQFMRDFEKNGR